MPFAFYGFLFLAVVLSFVGTYQYLVPKITGGAVGFTTDDFVHKMALGFIFTIFLGALGYLLAPYLFLTVLQVVYTSGPLVWMGFFEIALLVFVGTSLTCGLLTFVMGKTMPATLRCPGAKAAFKAGLAPGLVSTLIALVALSILLSSLHFD